MSAVKPRLSFCSLVVAARVDVDVLRVAHHHAVAVAVTNLGVDARDVLGNERTRSRRRAGTDAVIVRGEERIAAIYCSTHKHTSVLEDTNRQTAPEREKSHTTSAVQPAHVKTQKRAERGTAARAKEPHLSPKHHSHAKPPIPSQLTEDPTTESPTEPKPATAAASLSGS